jgi:hypothetical protein
MTKKSNKKGAERRTAASLVRRIAAREAEELLQHLGRYAEWNSAEKRREEKFQEIRRSLAAILGTDVDVEQEAIDAVEMWEETVGTEEDASADLKSPFELLLSDYHQICEEMLRIQDELCRGK